MPILFLCANQLLTVQWWPAELQITWCDRISQNAILSWVAHIFQVSLRQLSSGRQKSLQDKVLLLGHSTPITEVIFTNDVRCVTARSSAVRYKADALCYRKEACVAFRKTAILCSGTSAERLLKEKISETLTNETKCNEKSCIWNYFKSNWHLSRPADERLDFDQSFRDLQNHCETLAVAKASMDSLCVRRNISHPAVYSYSKTGLGCKSSFAKVGTILISSNTTCCFIFDLVCSFLQRCPGDQGVWKSRKIVGDTGIGKAIALSGGRDSGSLMICSSKRGVILIRVNTENLYSWKPEW